MSILNDIQKKIRKISSPDYIPPAIDQEGLDLYIREPDFMYSTCEQKQLWMDHIDELPPRYQERIRYHYDLCKKGEGHCRAGYGESIVPFLRILREWDKERE